METGPKSVGSVKSSHHHHKSAKFIKLKPLHSLCELELWTEMYYRWCTPVHYALGGVVQRFLAEQILCGEVIKFRQDYFDTKNKVDLSTTNRNQTAKVMKVQKSQKAPVYVLNESDDSETVLDDICLEDIR